ncbi:MAG: protein-L-isoaspartate O-methyltransferase family protein [Acidiphilium sp.]
MTEQKTDFTTARTLMVDRQIRPNDIVEPHLIAAFRTIPRENFLPAPLASRAYIDADIPLPEGRALLAPLTIGRLLRACAPQPGLAVLVIGAGTGYMAALLAQCGCRVTALESSAALHAIAAPALAKHAPAVRLLSGDLANGDPDGAPYDRIILEGQVATLPESLAAQLSATGRLISILRVRGLGRVIIAEAVTGGGFAHRTIADCAAPFLPGFTPKAEFVF